MRKHRFYKEHGQWFIDLKYFPYGKSKWQWMLAMVQGADDLLDVLAEGEEEITLQIDTYPIPFSDGFLEKHVSTGLKDGAFYFSRKGYMDTYDVQSINMVWLCPVTLWVFLKYPNKIYYKVVKESSLTIA